MTVPLTEKENQEEGQVSKEKIMSSIYLIWPWIMEICYFSPEGKKKGRKEKSFTLISALSSTNCSSDIRTATSVIFFKSSAFFCRLSKISTVEEKEYDAYVLLNRIKKNWKYRSCSIMWTAKGLAAHLPRKWKYQRFSFHLLEGLWRQLNSKYFLWIVKMHISFDIFSIHNFIKKHVN